MSKMQLLRALVAEKLAAAAEEIHGAVERMITERRTQGRKMSPEQQREVVLKRLSVVADEICRILEIMMGEYEADVSGSHEETQRRREPQDITLKTGTTKRLHRTDGLLGSDCEKDITAKLLKCEWSRISCQIQETSNPSAPQVNDASTETGPELIHGEAPRLHQIQRAEKSPLDGMETETRGERRVVPGVDQNVLSSDQSEAGSEDSDGSDAGLDEKCVKSNKREGGLRQSQGEDGCKVCGTSFHKGKKMKRHTRINTTHATGQSICGVCGKVFRYKRSFLKHALRHEQSSDRCGACGKHLDSDESLKVHRQTHDEEENVGRNVRRPAAERSDTEGKASDGDDGRDSEGADGRCGERDETCIGKPANAKNPVSSEADRPNNKEASQTKYRCKVCCKAFCYRASFLRHVQEEEREADVCGVCGERFDSEDSLRLHLQTYVQKHDCDVCGKRFDGRRQLETHRRTHTGEKPFVCAVCGKAFAQNGNLMGHMRVHTGERPYVCSVCGQGFGFKEYMTAHLRIHTGEKPFLCSVCGKGFRQRGTLKTHTMIHTGESAHQCSVCGKKFYKSGALKIHMRSHTGEKPYLCNVCGKRFAAGGSLTKHMGVHEGGADARILQG